MTSTGQDTLKTRTTFDVRQDLRLLLPRQSRRRARRRRRLPFSMKVLLENLLRFEDGRTVTRADIQALVDWQRHPLLDREIQYRPARVLMQDFTGVPAVVDLAAMRDAMAALGGNPEKINPLVPVHLVIDHSVMVDEFGTPKAFEAECRARISAQHRALRILEMGRSGVRQFQGRPARHRHLPPGQSRIYRARRVVVARARRRRRSPRRRSPRGRARGRSGPARGRPALRARTAAPARARRPPRSPIPTRSSAPTATPPWSTASACSAGASAGSRPRRRCSASRSRC